MKHFPIKIKADEFGSWTCFCGNDAFYEGLHPCDAKGDYIDTDESDWYGCDRCGRIVHNRTRRIVGFRKENTLTEDEQKRIVKDVKRYGLPRIKK